MSSEAARITGAASPMTFPDGTTYLSNPLRDIDIAELDEWVQSRAIALARMSLGPDATEAERQETMRIAIETSVNMSGFAGRGSRIMGTIDGMARLVWQMVKRNHRDVTPEEIRARLFDPTNPKIKENIDAAMAKFNEQNLRDVPGVASSANPPMNRQQKRAAASETRKKKSTVR